MTSPIFGADTPPLEVVGKRRGRRTRRFVPYLITVWFLLTLNFLLPRTMPGDPIQAMLAATGSVRVLTAEERADAIRYYGLHRPLWEQYGHYVGGLVTADLGVSIQYDRPVKDLLAERLPWTLLLGTTAVVIATVGGVAAGVYSGWRRGGRADRLLIGMFTAGRGVPPFFLASLALFVFAVKLRWVPLFGATTPFRTSSGVVASTVDVAHHLVLPAAIAALLFAGGSYLIMRSGMVSELGADYLLLGRAKGTSEQHLQYRYAARNAVLPLVAFVALEMGAGVSAGLIFIERVFAYPGVGQLMFESLESRDYPSIQGCFLLITLGVVTVNYLADVVVARLDPRTAA